MTKYYELFYFDKFTAIDKYSLKILILKKLDDPLYICTYTEMYKRLEALGYI